MRAIALVFCLAAMPVWAVDTEVPDPDSEAMDAARGLIAAESYGEAIPYLLDVIASGPPEPDALNLLGFAHRKIGQLAEAEIWYVRALDADPNHLGALEYQGELYLMTDRPDLARANLVRLTELCGACEEQLELAASLAAFAP